MFIARKISSEVQAAPAGHCKYSLAVAPNTCKYLLAMSSYELILNLSRPRVARRGENFSGDPISGPPSQVKWQATLSINGGEI
jgi:hypothetical protein